MASATAATFRPVQLQPAPAIAGEAACAPAARAAGARPGSRKGTAAAAAAALTTQ